MQTRLSDRARIGLDHLSDIDKVRLTNAVEELEKAAAPTDFPAKLVHVLKAAEGRNVYILRVGPSTRAVFTVEGSTITILELAHKDRLGLFRIGNPTKH